MINAPYNPGRLDRRVALRSPVETRSATGAALTAWLHECRLWAGWLPKGGREFYAAQAKHAEASGIIRIRYRTDLDQKWQVVLGDDVFDIIAIDEVGRREYLDLIVRALDQTPATSLIYRIEVALAAAAALTVGIIKDAFTTAPLAAAAELQAVAVKAAATVPDGLAAAADLAAAAVKDQAVSVPLAATAALTVAPVGVGSQRITSGGDRRVTSSGDVRIVYQYS